MKSVETQLQNQKGFTLVEIAIVLVIIGLLLAGVLKGQELIENSKVRSLTGDYEGISAAYWAYKDRTGDYPSADDSDGQFWKDLRAESFIAGLSDNASGPEHDFDGSFVYDNDGIRGGKAICAENVPARVAENIDNNLDDGSATTGDWQEVTTSTGYDGSETGLTLCKSLK